MGSVSVDLSASYKRDLFHLADEGTPRERAQEYRRELVEVKEELFKWSAKAVESGASIVFWAEANLFLYPEEEASFVEEAKVFAREHRVYFAPSVCLMLYGEHYGDNKLFLINPEGKTEFEYRKTKTIYHTESDGRIRFADTPYGRIGAAICFDMDFPDFVRQAGSSRIDLMLVPAFDSAGSTPYHTYTSLFRALENGFNMVRQVNHGASMAVDYQGHALAYQDFFKTRVRLMLTDLPCQGRRTLYALAGDWLAWLCLVFVLVAVGWTIRRAKMGA